MVGPDDVVYVGADYRRLYALHGNTGIPKWAPFLVPGTIGGAPLVGADETVYVASGDGSVTAVDTESGLQKWSLLLNGNGIGAESTPTLADDGTLYVGSSPPDGQYRGAPLIAVQASGRLVTSSWPKFGNNLENRGRVHSLPRMDAQQSRKTKSGFEVTIHAEAREVVQLDSSEVLSDWNDLALLTNSAAAPMRFLDTTTPGSNRFYRAHAIR